MSQQRKKKQNKSILEAYLMSVVQQSLKKTVDEALKEILKDLK